MREGLVYSHKVPHTSYRCFYFSTHSFQRNAFKHWVLSTVVERNDLLTTIHPPASSQQRLTGRLSLFCLTREITWWPGEWHGQGSPHCLRWPLPQRCGHPSSCRWRTPWSAAPPAEKRALGHFLVKGTSPALAWHIRQVLEKKNQRLYFFHLNPSPRV